MNISMKRSFAPAVEPHPPSVWLFFANIYEVGANRDAYPVRTKHQIQLAEAMLQPDTQVMQFGFCNGVADRISMRRDCIS